ncbi:MAG: COX15/CtaA family protein, partial [Pseudomonadota bacterium]|nr:COX15/CtaA family protein [Pseudomonadota bacterium]
FNSFPLMAGKWLPPGYLAAEPAWRNFFETIPTVQFNHRWLAIATFVLVLVFVARGWQDATLARYRRVLALFAGVASVQVVLGISTLLLHVPVILGAAHQGCALVLFTVALYLAFVSRHTAAGET